MLIHVYDSKAKLITSRAEPDDYSGECKDNHHEFMPGFKACQCGQWKQGALDLSRPKASTNHETGGPANYLKPGTEGHEAVKAVRSKK